MQNMNGLNYRRRRNFSYFADRRLLGGGAGVPSRRYLHIGQPWSQLREPPT